MKFLIATLLVASFLPTAVAQEGGGLRGLRPVENPGQGNAWGLNLSPGQGQGADKKRYVVVLREDSSNLDVKGRANAVAKQALNGGGQLGYIYESVFQGFSITLPATSAANMIQQIEQDFYVESISEDSLEELESQTIDSGIALVEADSNTKLGIDVSETYGDVDADIAILDSGTFGWRHIDRHILPIP